MFPSLSSSHDTLYCDGHDNNHHCANLCIHRSDEYNNTWARLLHLVLSPFISFLITSLLSLDRGDANFFMRFCWHSRVLGTKSPWSYALLSISTWFSKKLPPLLQLMYRNVPQTVGLTTIKMYTLKTHVDHNIPFFTNISMTRLVMIHSVCLLFLSKHMENSDLSFSLPPTCFCSKCTQL